MVPPAWDLRVLLRKDPFRTKLRINFALHEDKLLMEQSPLGGGAGFGELMTSKCNPTSKLHRWIRPHYIWSHTPPTYTAFSGMMGNHLMASEHHGLPILETLTSAG